MWFQKRHEARQDGTVPAGFVTGATGALAGLLAAIQDMVLPQQIYLMPFLGDGTVATEAATEIGRTDGRNLDDLTRTVRTSNLTTVLKYVQELLEVVGQRANAVLAAQKASTLTEVFQPSEPLTGWRATSSRTKLLMLVACVLEAAFGAKMAERLASSEDAVSWLVGVAIALLLTSSALAIAQAIHEQELGLVRGKGAWIALGVAVVAVAFLSVYAFGLGGGAEGTPTSGGLSGGSTPGMTSDAGNSENWVLVLVYCGLLLLLLSAVVLSHLIDLYVERVARVGVDVGIAPGFFPQSTRNASPSGCCTSASG